MIIRILEQVTFEPVEEKELAEQFRKGNPDFREELLGTKALSFLKERIYKATPMEGDE